MRALAARGRRSATPTEPDLEALLADRQPDLDVAVGRRPATTSAPTRRWSRQSAGCSSGEVDDGLALSPGVPDAWLGQGWEVHDLPTAEGRLSYAIRWHGDRPALLWELRAACRSAAPRG